MNAAIEKLRARCICGRVARAAGTEGTISLHPCHYCDIAVDVERLQADQDDARSGLRYIREEYGDLYGIGWDRLGIPAPERAP